MITEDQAIEIMRQMLMTTLLISAPILGVGLIIGLIVSLFQAVTQIQEQTLTFVPKIVGMALVAMIIMPWVGAKLIEFARMMFAP